MTVSSFIALALAGCIGSSLRLQQDSRHNESSHYKIVKLKRKNLTSPPLIQGIIVGETNLIPLAIGVIKIGRATVTADRTGNYSWQGKLGTYTIRARSVGFDDVVTEKIKLSKGDSIRLDFQFPIGQPIIHKMPKNR
ncbi:carboxypeptidase-like regulatory domain-containing protein [Hymenobacter sp. DG01]|uniref:carboxypeptidase-like regulatory domain-containing protein n=1 Tax=Hymenobacter sp. DG01 TaxID=2584940 RepID=UPI0011224864|nr:carboxypeptidase-like regulatory domain-containing protein [Hymenobacter sp. DG01]